MSARVRTAGAMPNPVPSRIIIGGASRRLEPRRAVAVADAAFGARRGMHDERARAGDSRSLGDRVVEVRRRSARARAPRAGANRARGRNRAANGRSRWPRTRAARPSDARRTRRALVSPRRSRDIVQVEAGDRRGDDAAVAVEHRMMDQATKRSATLRACAGARSNRDGAARSACASASRHARIFP